MSVFRSIADRALGLSGRGRLMRTASAVALATVLLATPAEAQLARMRGGAAGIPDATGVRAATGTAVRTPSMRDALVGQKAVQQRVAEVRGNVIAARQAAQVSTLRATPTQGLGERGLQPIAQIREAVRLSQEGGAANAAQAAQLLEAARAANDSTGRATWEGAGLPEQTVSGGQTTVAITQTQSRALLSWERMDVGANTTLAFKQADSSWTAVNRVVGSQDPTTILGKIEAVGGVYILNANGVIFGKGAQVNLRSLVASTLELGNYASNAGIVTDGSGRIVRLAGLTLQARNTSFLSNGLFPTSGNPTFGLVNGAPPLFLSPMLASIAGGPTASGGLPFGAAEGSVIVDPGAIITTTAGGLLVLAGPRVENHGLLSAIDGQVSLIGGRLVTFAQSTGEATSIDPNVRGIVFRSLDRDNRLPLPPAVPSAPDDGFILNRGLIESRRGYLSLVATARGEIVNDGLLSSTTSVSRNGKIGLYAGRVTIGGNVAAAQAGAIAILADESGETIPQGSPDEPAQFKRSQVEIGAFAYSQTQGATAADIANEVANPVGRLTQSTFVMGDNALIHAPNADVAIGQGGQSQLNILNPVGGSNQFALVPSSISIGANALIDVSGLKDVGVDVARNFITITPVKRNELRDTPTYREVAIGDDFTLNGLTLTVDIRRSGERDDGVRWVGSPLIEAGSLASQIPVTVSELMTTGGNVVFASSENVSLGRGAAVDFSGGWVSYSGTERTTSRLLTADGRVVDIGDADRNDTFVSVFSGFSATQPRFGVVDRFTNPIVAGPGLDVAYDEGRDAGSLIVEGAATRIDGTLRGSAFAGQRQLVDAIVPTAASALRGDTRKLQASGFELPSGGFVRLPTFGDIVVYRGTLNAPQSGFAQTLLNDRMLSDAGLSALSLEAFGQIIFAGARQTLLQANGAFSLTGASDLSLAAGGTLTARAGRSIVFDGTVNIASGTIRATTVSDLTSIGNTALPTTLIGLGSTFRTDDDIFAVYAADAALPSPFDIVVNGTLSTSGRWTNDSAASDLLQGGAWIDGGRIELTVAPSVLVALGGSVATALIAGDLSGSIGINQGARLSANAGGYLGADQRFDLGGRGGEVTLRNETRYAGTTQTQRAGVVSELGNGGQIFGGENQTVGFTPLARNSALGLGELNPALVPATPRSRVAIADGTISAYGFSGGGAFTLVSPDIAFGSAPAGALSTLVPLDFAARTGFGTIDLTSNRSRIVKGLFADRPDSRSAFDETTSFVVRAGETLDLTQTVLPFVTDRADVEALRALATGGDVLSVLTPSVPSAAFDRSAVNLSIGGLGELVVERGEATTREGRIVGAPQAVITAPKIINGGTITLPSGVLQQNAVAPNSAVQSAFLGVRSLAELLGRESGNSETAANLIVRGAGGALISNAEVFSLTGQDRLVGLLGVGDANTGIRLEAGSVTDLSGAVLLDSRAAFIQGGAPGVTAQARIGKILDGGSILTSSALNGETGSAVFGLSRSLDILQGAIVDISGTRQVFDQFVPGEGYVATEEWSSAGRIAALGGGSIAGGRINAFGGYGDDGGSFLRTGTIDLSLLERRAEGGTLEVSRAIFRQANPTVAVPNAYAADQIEAAGFDSLIARGGVRFDGAVDLQLRKAFIATSDVNRSGELQVGGSYTIGATTGADAIVTAGFIGFAARNAAALVPTTLALSDPAATNPGKVQFVARGQGIDFVGSTFFGPSIGTLGFSTPGDIRFIGIDGRAAGVIVSNPAGARLNGEFLSFANTVFDGGRTYATTGSGNLQLFLDAENGGQAVNLATTRPFQIAALGNHDITFASTAANAAVPLSAGSYVRVIAANIAQNGNLFAPLGRLELGSATFLDPIVRRATTSVVFGPGSLTSVSAAGTRIPYGTTLDLKEYFFTPLSLNALTVVPTSELRIAGGTIDVQAGSKIDLSGGGDTFGYEFVSGVGGSRDVLDRFNADAFSSNSFDAASGIGFQYGDRRQVFAILPKSQFDRIAPFDPLLSADYGQSGPVDLYGAQAGRTVILDGNQGIPAGEYVLLPAHYALLEGAFRVVENVGLTAPGQGQAQILLDGSTIVGGNYGYAGTGIAESARRSFTVQSAATFKTYSRLETQSGAAVVSAQATAQNVTVPRLPLDAARLVLSPLAALKVMGLFDTAGAPGSRGVQVDIAADNIVIAAQGAAATANFLTLGEDTLARLRPESLFIGGRRIDNGDGSTDLRVEANQIIVRSGVKIAVPELLLGVGNEITNGDFGTSRLTIENGASLTATGTLSRPDSADYVVQGFAGIDRPDGFIGDASGSGSVVRVAVGPDRRIMRTGQPLDPLVNANTFLNVGAALLAGETVAVTTTRLASFDPGARLTAPSLTIGGDGLVFNSTVLTPALTAQLAAAEKLTLRSNQAIGFAAGTYNFKNLSIDAPALALADLQLVGRQQANAVTINAGNVRLENSARALAACGGIGCGGLDDTLALNATEITFGSGTVRTIGFGGTVSLTASRGMFIEGQGALFSGVAKLSLTTPVIADRALAADPRAQKVRPDYLFGARGGIAVAAGGNTVPAFAVVAGNRAPGARIAFGDSDTTVSPEASALQDITIADSLILATAGAISLDAGRRATLSGGATLATPGWTKTFGDELDRVTVAASGGSIDILARRGGLDLGARVTLISDAGIGNAGAIGLRAPNGTVQFDGALNPALAGARHNDFALDTGTGQFDLAGFVARYGRLFGGEVSIRSGMGDLALGAGQALRTKAVSLTADGGRVIIAGTLDTSGIDVAGMSLATAKNARVDGGAIALYGRNGVSLTSTARLDTHTTGFADADPRQASAGDVTIGIGDGGGSIAIAIGARIDVGARRTQAAIAAGKPANRLVTEFAKEPGTLVDREVYRFVEADQGGDITLRAPLVGAGMDRVDITLPSPSTFIGAGSVQVEAYRRYDLDAIGTLTGILGAGAVEGGVALDPSLGSEAMSGALRTPYANNILSGDFVTASGLPSISHFVRNFTVQASDGSSFAGFRLRPGIELVSAGSISLENPWNLAAAEIDQAGAFAAGLLELNPELGTRDESNGLATAGTPYYSVVAGREGELLRRFGNFYYRVGGEAGREAPILRFRASGDVKIAGSISDGFFVFRDRSDQNFISYQLGGGDRTYDPALRLVCGVANGGQCDGLAQFGDIVTVGERTPRSARISLNNVVYGTLVSPVGTPAPFSQESNSPAALGNVFDTRSDRRIAGAGLEYGELFPLLPGGVAMNSSDIVLTAGGASRPSANPNYVDVSRPADVVVTDLAIGPDGREAITAYRLLADPVIPSFSNNLAIVSGNNIDAPSASILLDDFLTAPPEREFTGLDDNTFTILTWGSLSAQGRAFFASRSDTFTGNRNNPTGVIAPLGEVLQFLRTFAPDILSRASAGTINTSGTPQSPIRVPEAQRVYLQTFVRTGNGDLVVNAARDVDLRSGDRPIYRLDDGQSAGVNAQSATGFEPLQVGGAALYTAGVRAAAGVVQAQLANGSVRSFGIDGEIFSARPEAINVIPTPAARTDHDPVAAFKGGDLSVIAGRDVVGRLDLWTSNSKQLTFSSPTLDNRTGPEADVVSGLSSGTVGAPNQIWRVGSIGTDSSVGIVPEYFSSGIGAVAGGDVTVQAGRDLADLTVALDTSVVSSATGGSLALVTLGGGTLSLYSGRDLVGGRYDVTSGQGIVDIGRDARSMTTVVNSSFNLNGLRSDAPLFRLENASILLKATGSVGAVDAYGLGAGQSIATLVPTSGARDQGNAGLYSSVTAFSATALGDVAFAGGNFAPPSLELASLQGAVGLGATTTLYPSPIGQVSLLSAGDIGDFSLAMLDLDPSLLAQSAFASGVDLQPLATGFNNLQQFLAAYPARFPGVNVLVDEVARRQAHNNRITHLADFDPARIYTDGSITNTSINLAKFANVVAGVDIVDTFFVGQNVRAGDETRVSAGRDISATTKVGGPEANGLPYFDGTSLYLGGPGTFTVEAGRNLGPFASSAVVSRGSAGSTAITFAGGILTVGNEYNPWLPSAGADLNIGFGVAPGRDYATLRETYLNPQLFARLDGDLFEQVADDQGNLGPDRSRPVYAPILARWLRDNEPAAFAAVFGSQAFPSDAALATAAYSATDELYAAFAALSLQRQRGFLINELYFNELSQPSIPTSPSFQQFIRGYRAIEALFPTALGYTDNLAAYDLDPATVSASNPLGVPRRKLVNGQPAVADRVVTGNADLRLATLQTARGGDLTVIAPGGDFLVGSVVRTTEQTDRRATRFVPIDNGVTTLPTIIEFGGRIASSRRIQAVPLGFEGLLTLRGGDIRSFTDGDLRLNQSRLFTISGGDISAWSSNGDLNAGQGPKTSANFPPVSVRFDLNGTAQVDTAGGVAGAGIGAFKQKPSDPESTIILVAPVGEVDAGDAGVRASGNIFVAAARVANADNFAAGGSISGVPSSAPVAQAAPPSSAASTVANVARAALQSQPEDRRTSISVDILGFAGGEKCRDPEVNDPACPK